MRAQERAYLQAAARNEFSKRLDDGSAQRCAARRAARSASPMVNVNADADEHEQRNDPDHPVPCQMVREHKRERAGNQSRDSDTSECEPRCRARVPDPGSSSRRYASSTMSCVALKNATMTASHRIDRRSVVWMPLTHQHDRREQAYLSDEHPAASPPQQRQLITIEQRGPERTSRHTATGPTQASRSA